MATKMHDVFFVDAQESAPQSMLSVILYVLKDADFNCSLSCMIRPGVQSAHYLSCQLS
jgi:hypothetical protein